MPLPLQRINNIDGSNGLPHRMLRVHNRVSYHILQEHLQHATCLFINQTANTLHATTSCKPTDCRLHNSLNVVPTDCRLRNSLTVVPKNLRVSFCSSFFQSFASFFSLPDIFSL
ncbi:hypothetical protein Hanom_Chr16g01425841 [Helianthus anomalus]